MLSKEHFIFLRILKSAISNTPYDIAVGQTDTDTAVDLGKILRLGRIHKVMPMVCDTIYRSPGINTDPIYKHAEKEAVRAVAGQVIRSAQFSDLYLFLSERGLRPIVVKGIIVRQLYPRSHFRESVDEDLWIEQEKTADYYKAFRDYGLDESTCDTPDSEDAIRSFVHSQTQLNIDIHTFSSAADAEQPEYLNRVFEHTADVEINGVQFHTLQPEDHLFYLIMHAFKHFLHSGFGIRQVCDIVLYAEHARNEIDWKTLAEKLKNAKAYEFTLAIFRIGEKYLLNGSHLETLLLIDGIEINPVNEEPLLMDILEGGLYGSASMTRLHSSTVTLQAVKNSSAGHSPFRIICSSVFLPIEKMRGKYTYLDKMPFLLPAAWLQRVFHYMTELFLSRKESNTALKTNNAIESIKLGQERLKLLKEYHIID